MEQSTNHIKRLSQRQPNEVLQKLVEDYQLSKRRNTIHLDNNVTLPFPNDEQKKTHGRQRSVNKKKRNSMYQDYSNNLASDINSTADRQRVSSLQHVPSGRYHHCLPVHTRYQSSLLKSFDIGSEYFDVPDSVTNSTADDENKDDVRTPQIKTPQKEQLSFIGIRNLIFIILLSTNFGFFLQLCNKSSLSTCYYYINFYLKHNDDLMYFLYAMVTSFISLSAAFVIEKLALSTVLPSSKFHRLLHLHKGSKTLKKQTSLTNIQLKPITDLATVNKISSLVFIAHLANIMTNLTVVNYSVFLSVHNCLIGSFMTFHSVILSFKLTSYYLTNKELRELYAKSSNQKTLVSSSNFLNTDLPEGRTQPIIFLPLEYDTCQYPQNITFANINEFWILPTLVYQPVYPTFTERKINYKYICYKFIEILAAATVTIYLNNYHALPIFEDLLSVLTEESLSSTIRSLQILELLIRLSTISIVMWFLIYYSYFHNFLNILAEYSKFGDRSFYYNWWNSDSILKYWLNWNKPLSVFLKRHFVEQNSNKSKITTFIICAIIAELTIAIPTHSILGLAFLTMSAQMLLIYFTERLNPGSEKIEKMSFTGNCLFWCSFFVGQPMCYLFYYLSWCLKNNYSIEHTYRK